MTASIGIAFGRSGDDPGEVLRDADAARHQAKLHGGGGIELFDSRLNIKAHERLELESALRDAIDRDELEVYYQPLVELPSRRAVGFEALLRWHRDGAARASRRLHPAGRGDGPDPPDRALGAGRGLRAGGALERGARRRAAVRLGERLGAPDRRARACPRPCRAALAASGLEPGLPVARDHGERCCSSRTARRLATLERIQRLGVRLSMDDFGTGYSSLSYLKRFPIEELKIDRAFVTDLARSAEDCELVAAIVAMAHALGFSVLAEGVETEEQLDALQDLDVTPGAGLPVLARRCRPRRPAACSPPGGVVAPGRAAALSLAPTRILRPRASVPWEGRPSRPGRAVADAQVAQMIRPEQLADALQRLEPRDRELLSLSLHRRVPDEALARMYDYEPAEVSRRRAAAIERLADDLRVQRGEDLGSVLKALLEPGTWSGIEPAPGREFAVPEPPARPRDSTRAAARRAQAARSRPTAAGPPPAPSPRRPCRCRAGAGARPPEPEPRAGGAAARRRSRRSRTRAARRPTSRCSTCSPRDAGAARAPGRRVRTGFLTLAALGAAALVGAAGADGRHAALGDDDSGGSARAGRRRRHAQLRARQGRPARGAVRLRPADLVLLLDRLRAASPPSSSASRAASRACGSPSAPSGARRACSASSASAATGSACRPRS